MVTVEVAGNGVFVSDNSLPSAGTARVVDRRIIGLVSVVDDKIVRSYSFDIETLIINTKKFLLLFDIPVPEINTCKSSQKT